MCARIFPDVQLIIPCRRGIVNTQALRRGILFGLLLFYAQRYLFTVHIPFLDVAGGRGVAYGHGQHILRNGVAEAATHA